MNVHARCLTSSSDAPSGTTMSNVTIAPAPFGEIFFCSSLYGDDARPAYCTLATSSRASSHSAMRCALDTWRSIRRLRAVSYTHLTLPTILRV